MDKILNFIPFFLVTGSGNPRPNIPRIIEALIIAAIAGAVSGYISVAKLETKIDFICVDNVRQEHRIDETLNRLERLAEVVNEHKGRLERK